MEIKQYPSKNFSGRQGSKIVAIVNHITAGKYPGCRDWLCNPAAKASAHYIVTRDGQIIQLVADINSAWHAGGVNKSNWPLYDGVNPNRRTIGIEHEGYTGAGAGGDLTEAQYQATLWLHRQLIAKHNILVDKDHIIGHYRIDSVNRPNCPGPKFPWDRLFNDLRSKVNPEQWKLDIITEAKRAGLITSDHDPNEPVTAWLLLQVSLNTLKASALV